MSDVTELAKQMAFAVRHPLDACDDADEYWSHISDDHHAYWLKAAAPAAAQLAENEVLREALDRAYFVMRMMGHIAGKVGLEGSPEWDQIAGSHDLHGAIDLARRAIAGDAQNEAD